MKQLTKKEFSDLYYSKKNIEVCEILGISEPTLLKYLEESGIKKKGMGWRGKQMRKKILGLD